MPIAAKATKTAAARPKTAAKPVAKTKAAKPAAKVAAATPAPKVAPKAVRRQPAAKSVSEPTSATRKRSAPKIDADQRRHYVEVAAYYIAERRGFLGGCEAEDWVQAETEIDRLLLEGKLIA